MCYCGSSGRNLVIASHESDLRLEIILRPLGDVCCSVETWIDYGSFREAAEQLQDYSRSEMTAMRRLI